MPAGTDADKTPQAYLLSRDAARRTAAAVRAVERMPVTGRKTARARTFGGGGPAGKVAVTYSAGVPAGSLSAPGSGTVRLKLVTALGYQDTGADVTAYNSSSTAVGGNKVVQMKWIDGYWFIDVESC